VHGDLGGRQRNDQPSIAGIDGPVAAQDLAKDRPVRLGIGTVDDRVGCSDHQTSRRTGRRRRRRPGIKTAAGGEPRAQPSSRSPADHHGDALNLVGVIATGPAVRWVLDGAVAVFDRNLGRALERSDPG
jgi:hypothetical protein